jgi:hypothetical protein
MQYLVGASESPHGVHVTTTSIVQRCGDVDSLGVPRALQWQNQPSNAHLSNGRLLSSSPFCWEKTMWTKDVQDATVKRKNNLIVEAVPSNVAPPLPGNSFIHELFSTSYQLPSFSCKTEFFEERWCVLMLVFLLPALCLES